MSDMLEIFSRDPLSYTKEGGELRIIIEEMRKKRAQFNLGNISAGTTKPPTEKQKAALALADKLDLKGGLDL